VWTQLRAGWRQAMAGLAAVTLPAWSAHAQSDDPPQSLRDPDGGSGGGSAAPLDLGFQINADDNLYLIWLAGALVAAVFGALFHYRAQLEKFIRNGVHPQQFAGSVYIGWFGAFLLLAFLIPLWNADLGIHLLLLVSFIVVCLAGFLIGRLLWKFAVVVLVLMCLVGIFRHWGMVA
jgi:hypothetical protein